MIIFDYSTNGGKNIITSYIDTLPAKHQLELYMVRDEIEKNGLDAFKKLNTRQLRGKLWEIKVSQYRMMYIIMNKDSVAFLNICKKQKGKAEKQELYKALKRANEENLL